VRLRRARTLVIKFVDSTPILQNFLTQKSIVCDSFTIDLLSKASVWEDPQQFLALYPAVDPAAIVAHLNILVEQSFLVVEDTPAATFDTQYEVAWSWDTTAGLYHFGMKDPPYLNPAQAVSWMGQRSLSAPPVSMFTTNESCAYVKKLPKPDIAGNFFSLLNRRRSIRSFLPAPLSLDALRDCLFAGLGITGFLDTHFPGSARMIPLKMAPSGGGRNPYEAYVYALNVKDLPSGLYHYSAIENSLGLLTSSPDVSPTQLLVGQYWAEDAGALILLVANFERSMWKYPHPTAYRVVLIEAGHIGQNVALAAANQGLTAVPTAAFSDTAAQNLLNLDWIKQSLVYVLLVGAPRPNAFEVEDFTPHVPPE
jgi:SagB-type dehydrogenase family enzyme